MQSRRILCLLALTLAVSCSGGGSAGGGSFEMIEFLESGLAGIARNAVLVFRFSDAVAPDQDFSERLRIQNIQSGQAGSDMTKAIGVYLVSGEIVTFAPRLPELRDRSDSGFRSLGNYHVFLKAGPDSLMSTGRARIALQQEYTFDTSEFFEDPIPNDPPRALAMMAVDSTNGAKTDISRADPRPDALALMNNAELAAAGKIINPGAGGDYRSFWTFELEISEPLDPSSVDTKNVEMWEIRSDVFEAQPDVVGSDTKGKVLIPP